MEKRCLKESSLSAVKRINPGMFGMEGEVMSLCWGCSSHWRERDKDKMSEARSSDATMWLWANRANFRASVVWLAYWTWYMALFLKPVYKVSNTLPSKGEVLRGGVGWPWRLASMHRMRRMWCCVPTGTLFALSLKWGTWGKLAAMLWGYSTSPPEWSNDEAPRPPINNSARKLS